MGKLKTAAIALVVLVALGACLGGGGAGDENGDDEINENGENEAQAADEAQDNSGEEADESDETESEADEAADEDDLPDTDEVDESEQANEADETADETDEEIEEETDEPSQESLQAAGPVVLESTLEDSGIMVETVEEQGNTLYVEYTTFETTEQGIAREIGAVAGAYAGISGEGYQSNQMDVSVRGADGSEIGTYQADSDDAGAYYNGEMSDEQYLQTVLETLVA